MMPCVFLATCVISVMCTPGYTGFSFLAWVGNLWCFGKTGRLVLHRESKKWCHPNHGYNFVSSWSICKILSLRQRV